MSLFKRNSTRGSLPKQRVTVHLYALFQPGETEQVHHWSAIAAHGEMIVTARAEYKWDAIHAIDQELARMGYQRGITK